MTDAIDQACELEQQQREQAIAAAKLPSEKPNDLHGHRYCLACDVELNTKRLLVMPSATRCVPCQNLFEHKNKRLY